MAGSRGGDKGSATSRQLAAEESSVLHGRGRAHRERRARLSRAWRSESSNRLGSRTSAKLPDAEEAYLLDIFAKRVDQEHLLISHRMTWLMALDGFLVAGYALLLANADKVGSPHALALSIVGISLLGTISNASCFFSNYWGGRAIQEADGALTHALRATRGSPSRSLEPRLYLRLYGRDPNDAWTREDRESSQAFLFRPPSQPLHPWFLLPLSFGATFAALPLVGRLLVSSREAGSSVYEFSGALAIIPVMVVLSVFGVLGAWDYQRRWDMRQVLVRVRDDHKKPIQGAKVRLEAPRASAFSRQQDVDRVPGNEGWKETGRNGCARLTGSTGTVYKLIVTAPGYKPNETHDEIICGGERIDVELESATSAAAQLGGASPQAGHAAEAWALSPKV